MCSRCSPASVRTADSRARAGPLDGTRANESRVPKRPTAICLLHDLSKIDASWRQETAAKPESAHERRPAPPSGLPLRRTGECSDSPPLVNSARSPTSGEGGQRPARPGTLAGGPRQHRPDLEDPAKSALPAEDLKLRSRRRPHLRSVPPEILQSVGVDRGSRRRRAESEGRSRHRRRLGARQPCMRGPAPSPHDPR